MSKLGNICSRGCKKNHVLSDVHGGKRSDRCVLLISSSRHGQPPSAPHKHVKARKWTHCQTRWARPVLWISSSYSQRHTRISPQHQQPSSQLLALTRPRRSSSPYLPPDARNTHLFPGLLVVVKPLALGEINPCELCPRLRAYGFPVALIRMSALRPVETFLPHKPDEHQSGLTSALNSTNSRPRQSMVITFIGFGGSCCA